MFYHPYEHLEAMKNFSVFINEYVNKRQLPPDTFPIDAMDSTNKSRAGKGDFPEKYASGGLSVQVRNASSWRALELC